VVAVEALSFQAGGEGTSAAIERWHDVHVGAITSPGDYSCWWALRANAPVSDGWQPPHVAGSAARRTMLDGSALFTTPRWAVSSDTFPLAVIGAALKGA
jgi:hypothetical protein